MVEQLSNVLIGQAFKGQTLGQTFAAQQPSQRRGVGCCRQGQTMANLRIRKVSDQNQIYSLEQYT
jgi:hypothetical protein